MDGLGGLFRYVSVLVASVPRFIADAIPECCLMASKTISAIDASPSLVSTKRVCAYSFVGFALPACEGEVMAFGSLWEGRVLLLMDVGWIRSGSIFVEIVGYDWAGANVCVEVVDALEMESCDGCFKCVLL